MPDTAPLRQQLDGSPADILQRLPQLGRVMIVVRGGGATHERIGVVETVEAEGAAMVCRGAAHDAAIDVSTIGQVIVDRSGKMKDKVLPRLEFVSSDGENLFSVVGLDGLEPFDHALAQLGGSALPPADRPPMEAATLGDSDPAATPLEAASASKSRITIEMRRRGIVQRWQGIVEAVKPGMGFVNVMTENFHLHLRGGAISGWRAHSASGGELAALGQDGRPIGLVLHGAPAPAAQA